MTSPAGQLVVYSGAAVSVRPDIVAAHRQVWDRLAKPGTWLTGPQRLAAAQATRAARDCSFCHERKAALSPHSIDGTHDGDSTLAIELVDAVHRVVTDPGRLTQQMLVDLATAGVDRRMYVEALGVAVRTAAIDSFCRAIGQPLHALPPAEAGEPSRQDPSAMDDIGAWVPVINAKDPIVRQIYGRVPRLSNVARALSSVPEESRDQVALVKAMYLPLRDLASTSDGGRAISRAQIELVASKVSTINECFY